MRLHRFFVNPDIELKHDFWVHDERLVHQWRNVLRFGAGQELVLFDGRGSDKLYRLEEINERETHLVHVTDLEPKFPKREIYLLWALLKKDKNDWVLQKCTELGVSHFVPLLAERSEKKGFNLERAEKIVTEAAEQCGRSDIPTVREPVHPETAITELKGKMQLFICEQGEEELASNSLDAAGILIGPEGGWADREKSLFTEHQLPHLNLHDFTLRAETAAVTAASKLLQ